MCSGAELPEASNVPWTASAKCAGRFGFGLKGRKRDNGTANTLDLVGKADRRRKKRAPVSESSGGQLPQVRIGPQSM